VSEHMSFVVETGNEHLEIYKSPETDQILAELIQGRGNTLRSETHKFIYWICNEEKCHNIGKTLLFTYL
jgi:hypothetical protein